MTESTEGATNGNAESESFAEAARQNGRHWHNGNGATCPLDAGVASIKQQLAQMKAAQNAHERFAMEQLRVTMGQQTAQACLDASKAALTQALRANDHEGVADSIIAIIDAVARWYRAGEDEMDSRFRHPKAAWPLLPPRQSHI